MAFIPKNGKIKKEKNKHPTILKIPDSLWDEIKNILPKEKLPETVGRRPIISYRKVIDGILYILRTGCQWKMLLLSMVLVLLVTVGFKNGIALIYSKRYG